MSGIAKCLEKTNMNREFYPRDIYQRAQNLLLVYAGERTLPITKWS
jgi:hypothetical protein